MPLIITLNLYVNLPLNDHFNSTIGQNRTKPRQTEKQISNTIIYPSTKLSTYRNQSSLAVNSAEISAIIELIDFKTQKRILSLYPEQHLK